MNNSKMWLVVSPSVGVPVFLGAVAVGSFAVHVAVLSSTGWVNDFLQGEPLGSTATASLITDEATTQAASYEALDGQAIIVTLPDGTQARAVLEMPETMASARLLPDG